MRILDLITNHQHYWGVPHRRATDDCLVMTCYECGREHQVHTSLRPADERADAEYARGAVAA